MISHIVTMIADRTIDLQYHLILRKMEGKSMTYKLMKRIIEKGNYDKDNTLQKLDVFLMADRITVEEYQELVEMINGGKKDE